MAENRVTQVVTEVVHGGSPNVRLSQEVIEAVHGGTPIIRNTQFVVESVHGGSPFIDLSQFVIEVVLKRSVAGPPNIVRGSGNVVSVGVVGCLCVRRIGGVCEHSMDVPETDIVGTPTEWSPCEEGFPIECT